MILFVYKTSSPNPAELFRASDKGTWSLWTFMNLESTSATETCEAFPPHLAGGSRRCKGEISETFFREVQGQFLWCAPCTHDFSCNAILPAGNIERMCCSTDGNTPDWCCQGTRTWKEDSNKSSASNKFSASVKLTLRIWLRSWQAATRVARKIKKRTNAWGTLTPSIAKKQSL